eukprot:3906853-Alexandrium_andersonii.AAC.1
MGDRAPGFAEYRGAVCRLRWSQSASCSASALRSQHRLPAPRAPVVRIGWRRGLAVSYTHLTLPTICSV